MDKTFEDFGEEWENGHGTVIIERFRVFLLRDRYNLSFFPGLWLYTVGD